MRLSILLIAALPCLSTASAGPSDQVNLMHRVTGGQVLRLLEENGDTPRLTKDDLGDPMIHAQHNNVNYSVIFYDCDAESRCGSLQFRTWYRLDPPLALDEVNEWNRLSRLGRAYLDSDGDATIEYNIRLVGGISTEHLREERDWFLRAVKEFQAMLLRLP